MSTQSTAPYDTHFCFPVRELESDRVKLTPFIPTQHADLFFQGSSSHPDLYQHISFGPFSSSTAFIGRVLQGRVQLDPGSILYAIIDKTRTPPPSPPPPPPTSGGTHAPPSHADFAGTIGYFHGSPTNLCIEIGFTVVLPPFQRTHVTTHAVALLLRYALDLPTASPPGLGLRRVQWRSSEKNEASIKVAERMGFKREARLRWDRVFPGDQGKVGNGEDIREGDPRPGTLGRHTVILAICWDDWENGGREQVAQLMDR